MSHEPDGFDLNAAWIRRAQGDLKPFLTAFAARMEGALPGRVTVERRRDGLFSANSHVVKVAISTGPNVYTLALTSSGLAGMRSKSVHGVTLSSQTLPVTEWLTELNRAMQALAAEEGAAQTVLHDFLIN